MIAIADNELAPSALFVITPTITANHDNTDIIPTNNMNTIPMSVIWSANYAQTECQFRYCGTAIPFLTVRSTAR